MIIKLNYVKNFQKEKIKATVRYNGHRRGKEGEKMSRDYFGWDNKRFDKDEIYTMIDAAAKDMKYFRFKLSPDPHTVNTDKNLDLWKVTQDFMLKIRDQRGAFQFVAVEHNDHTDIPHVHAIVLLGGRVTKADLADFRQMGREVTLSQRQALASAQEKRHHLSFIAHASFGYKSQQNRRIASGKAIYIHQPRELTPLCPQGGLHSMVKLTGNEGKYYCPVHERVYEQAQGLSL